MKSIKYSIILIFFFNTLPLLITGQSNTFSKIYCPQNIAAIGQHILVSDSGYVSGGIDIDSTTGLQTLVLLLIDTNGNITKTVYPVTNTIKYYPGTPGSLSVTNDGFIWAGGKNNGIKAMGFLIKIDSLLNLKWEQEYQLNTDSVYSFLSLLQVKQIAGGGYALIGCVGASGQYNNDILLIITDSVGNKLMQKTYNYKGIDWGWNIIQTPDHGFLIGAGGYIATQNQSYTGLIIKTDSLGNEQWRKQIGSQYDDNKCIVANAPDGNFIVGTMTGIGLATPDFSYRKARLMKVNNAGSTLWDKSYGKSVTISSISQVLILPNGDILSIGYYYPLISEGPHSWSWMLKTNTNGDSIWYREHYLFNMYGADNELYDIKHTPDGGYILCGEADSLQMPQHIWVLKVDSFGCVVPGCQNVGMKELVMKNEELGMYPNPASEVVTLKLPGFVAQDAQEVRLFSSTGQEVLRELLTPGNDTPTISIRHLPPGAYFVRVITAKMSVVSSKVLIISN